MHVIFECMYIFLVSNSTEKLFRFFRRFSRFYRQIVSPKWFTGKSLNEARNDKHIQSAKSCFIFILFKLV